MIQKRSHHILIALLSTSFFIGFTQSAAAQDGIVRLSQPPPLTGEIKKQPNKTASPTTQTEALPDEVSVGDLVIPPALIVIKRNPQAITIPVNEVAPTEDESEFTEQPVVSSNTRVNSFFGYRSDPFTRGARFHSGIDLKAKWGTPLGASHAGVVKSAGWQSGYGNLVVIDHGGGVTTHYAHLSRFAVSVGDVVERGTLIGYAGSTGRATSPHLHYEVRLDGKPLNPLRALALDAESEFFNAAAANRTEKTTTGSTPEQKP